MGSQGAHEGRQKWQNDDQTFLAKVTLWRLLFLCSPSRPPMISSSSSALEVLLWLGRPSSVLSLIQRALSFFLAVVGWDLRLGPRYMGLTSQPGKQVRAVVTSGSWW